MMLRFTHGIRSATITLYSWPNSKMVIWSGPITIPSNNSAGKFLKPLLPSWHHNVANANLLPLQQQVQPLCPQQQSQTHDTANLTNRTNALSKTITRTTRGLRSDTCVLVALRCEIGFIATQSASANRSEIALTPPKTRMTQKTRTRSNAPQSHGRYS